MERIMTGGAGVSAGTMPANAAPAAAVAGGATADGGTAAAAETLPGVMAEPSLTVSERTPAEQLLTRPFEAARRTAENLVDTPEERTKKAQERKREEAKRTVEERTELLAERAEALRDAVPPPVTMV